MSSNKLEYDSSLGGSVVLPTHLQTYRYASSCVEEIKKLLNEVRNPSSTKLVFQTLPKHMRRRAMSHHPKRLPRKYRFKHLSQMAKSGNPQNTKRPSRKYRRKPMNLLKEYIRRQRKHIWLETHIWHAKRFHMITRWGYRLPYASCDKMYRACYRASANHCLLQDISFYACLQFQGTVKVISEGFAKISSSRCGRTIAGVTFTSGRREGCIELFKANRYPEGALGKVLFMWKPLETTNNDENVQRILWVWVHPNSYQTILEELIKVFDLTSLKSIKIPINEDNTNVNVKKGSDIQRETKHGAKDILKKESANVEELCREEDSNSLRRLRKANSEKFSMDKQLSKKHERRLQFMTRTFSYERIKRYQNANNSIQLCELKDTLNRFRLTGPLAQSILIKAFKPAPYLDPAQISSANWFHAAYARKQNFAKIHQVQTEFWEKCGSVTSPGELMSNMIVALNIEDPRVNRPSKRTKALPLNEPKSAQLQNWLFDPPAQLAQSCLWETDIRDKVCAEMLSTQAYCEQRAKHAVVPGEPCLFEKQMQPLPVLLVQRPGSRIANYKRLGYGCGWDVIAPAGYGMPIWLALIMWGARPGGLREFATISRELGLDEFLPDTVGGQQHLAERHMELRSKYFRLPPNKRCNYNKFSIISPFRAPLRELVRDWEVQTTPTKSETTATPSTILPQRELTSTCFYVLRDIFTLQMLQDCIVRKSTNFPKELSPKCLLQLQLIMKSRGNPGDFAVICLPTQRDFKRNLKLHYRGNHEPIYTEPLKTDSNEKQRKLLRTEHKKLLKRLRNKRVREKRKLQETSKFKVRIRPAETAEIVASQFQRMCSLWLPETEFDKPNSIRHQCTREVFGYVTNCSFTFTEARVCAIGYVTLEGLRRLLATCRTIHLKEPMCLLRGTDSRHYHFASFKINLQV